MAHEVIKRINSSLMANGLSTEDDFYKALWGDEVFTPADPIGASSDYNCGAIANELEYALGTSDAVTRAGMVEDLPDTFGKLMVTFLTGYITSGSTTIKDIINRMYAVIYRNGSRTLMTKWGMLEAVAYYYSNKAHIYINENKITGSNLVTNPAFKDVLSVWSTTQSGSTTVSRVLSTPFEGSTSIEFSVDESQSTGTLEQTITGMTDATHFLSFFVYDNEAADGDSVVSVEVTRASDGYYYDFDGLSWQSSQIEKPFNMDSSDHYTQVDLPITYEDTSDMTLRIKNSGASTVAHVFNVDHFELGVKGYPNVEVILTSQGTDGEYLQTWENGEDPVGFASGTADSDSSSKLIDSSATFSSDGVQPDDFAWNTTDDVSARVVSVDSETQLTLDSDAFPNGNEDYTITENDYQGQAGFLNSSYLGGYAGGGIHTIGSILEDIKPAGVHTTLTLVPRAV